MPLISEETLIATSELECDLIALGEFVLNGRAVVPELLDSIRKAATLPLLAFAETRLRTTLSQPNLGEIETEAAMVAMVGLIWYSNHETKRQLEAQNLTNEMDVTNGNRQI